MAETGINEAYVTSEWIRRPLPDLGGASPQEAAADPQGRKRLEDLFIELAGHYVRLANLGLPAFDPQHLRKALGMEEPAPAHAPRPPARQVRTGPVKRHPLLDELGTALTGGDVDSVAFFNVKSGTVEHFMHNLGEQEATRIAQAEQDPDRRKITPVTTEVRYGIMSDFIGLVEDISVAGRLRSAISGKGAFRRFREAVDEDDALRRRWLSYRTKRHYLIALDWLHGLGLDPAQYGINASDYDWQPSAAAAHPTTASGAPPAGATVEHGSQPGGSAAASGPDVESGATAPEAHSVSPSETAANDAVGDGEPAAMGSEGS
jgi:hypothetical protein